MGKCWYFSGLGNIGISIWWYWYRYGYWYFSFCISITQPWHFAVIEKFSWKMFALWNLSKGFIGGFLEAFLDIGKIYWNFFGLGFGCVERQFLHFENCIVIFNFGIFNFLPFLNLTHSVLHIVAYACTRSAQPD